MQLKAFFCLMVASITTSAQAGILVEFEALSPVLGGFSAHIDNRGITRPFRADQMISCWVETGYTCVGGFVSYSSYSNFNNVQMSVRRPNGWTDTHLYLFPDMTLSGSYLTPPSFGNQGRVTFSQIPGRGFGAVPEPQGWMLLLAGFGAVGISLRRRPHLTARHSTP
jgi:hypothetical protein